MPKGPTRSVFYLRLRNAAAALSLSIFLAFPSFTAAAESASDSTSQSATSSGTTSSSAALPEAPQAQAEAKDAIKLVDLPLNILKDQGPIWTSPFRIRTHDLIWVLPLAAATGIGIATDQHVMNDVISK